MQLVVGKLYLWLLPRQPLLSLQYLLNLIREVDPKKMDNLLFLFLLSNIVLFESLQILSKPSLPSLPLLLILTKLPCLISLYLHHHTNYSNLLYKLNTNIPSLHLIIAVNHYYTQIEQQVYEISALPQVSLKVNRPLVLMKQLETHSQHSQALLTGHYTSSQKAKLKQATAKRSLDLGTLIKEVP